MRRLLFALGGVTALTVIACWPVTTRFGVNYAWSAKRIPLYEKAIQFLSRDMQTRRLVREVIGGAEYEDDILMQLFSWVTTHVRPQPSGWPVIDDHVHHIMIRGYGTPEQMADVLSVLAGYAGFRARVVRLEATERSRRFVYVTFVESGDQTFVFDPANTVAFTDDAGRLISLHELENDPQRITAATADRWLDGIPYAHYLRSSDRAKTFSRAEAQRLIPRLKHEMAQFFHGRAD